MKVRVAQVEREDLEAQLESMLAALAGLGVGDIRAFRRWWWEELWRLAELSYQIIGEEEDDDGDDD